jgi:hypothetical protein
MARIRSLKPDFWLDRKLARSCSRDARMLYMGLWNQADEWGRANGDEAVIKGQIFPYDEDVKIPELLAELTAIGRVQQYDFDGDPYLFLPKLANHQRLEPAKAQSKLPEPPDPALVPDPPSSQAHSEKIAAESEPIAAESEKKDASLWDREQGSGDRGRGAREKRGADNSAQTLVGEWLDRCDPPPPGRVKGQVAKLLGELLAEGQPYDVVRNGLAVWHRRNLNPATLPSVVYETARGPTPRNPTAERNGAHVTLVNELTAERLEAERQKAIT